MKKFFAVLTNAGKIFRYLNVFSRMSEGLRVTIVALETVIAEIKSGDPEFKHFDVLESVLLFLKTVKDVVDAFNGIFGANCASDGRSVSECSAKKTSGAYVEDINSATNDMKEFLGENR